MTNTELMWAAITSGLDDDVTTAAALDAVREESGCSLLAAVLEVARVWTSAHAARELTEATQHLAEGSPLRHHIYQIALGECLNVVPGTLSTIVVIEGDSWPRAELHDVGVPEYAVQTATVTVGALWVKRVASRLMLEHEREANRPRRRRAN